PRMRASAQRSSAVEAAGAISSEKVGTGNARACPGFISGLLLSRLDYVTDDASSRLSRQARRIRHPIDRGPAWRSANFQTSVTRLGCLPAQIAGGFERADAGKPRPSFDRGGPGCDV